MTPRTACLLLVMSVPSCRRPSDVCQVNAQCPEGMKCFETVCAPACLEMTCLDGHFCDPDTNECVTECPFACNPPDHSTLTCEAACGYTCQGGFYLDDLGACPACDVPEHCGPDCTPCTTPANGTAVCTSGACGRNCSGGFYDTGATCAPCNATDHCGPSCAPCASGESCDGGTTCVASTAPPRFVRNITTVPDQPTVSDTTGLIWQGCTAGQSGSDCRNGGAGLVKWEYAKTYCETTLNAQGWGGYTSGWRLPAQPTTTSGELSSLLLTPCPGGTSPCIDAAMFPNTPASWFWTSYTTGTDLARYVSFAEGQVIYSARGTNGGSSHVRCVRNQ
jgi:hypothetical protein